MSLFRRWVYKGTANFKGDFADHCIHFGGRRLYWTRASAQRAADEDRDQMAAYLQENMPERDIEVEVQVKEWCAL